MAAIFRRGYSILIAIGDALRSPLLLGIRLFWGCAFLHAGLGKLGNIDQVIAFFQSLGIPMPALNAYLAATVECVGGACLILGLLSRLISIPLIFTMIIAYVTADMEAVKMVFSQPLNFVQREPFTFLFAAILVFVFGPGSISLDHWFKKK
ncbi:MAG: DoxX family protein [Simkania sp.]|nr:DoxX family protein [Simkania sp.]